MENVDDIDLEGKVGESDVGVGHQPGRRGASASRKPLVRRFPNDGVAVELDEWLEDRFEHAVGLHSGDTRAITPFVGPGMLQVDPSKEEIRWDRSIDRAGRDDVGLGRFVMQLRDERCKGRTIDEFDPDGLGQSSLSDIRLGLALLAHQATTTFVQKAQVGSVPLNLWREHGVALGEDDPVLPVLLEVIQALEEHLEVFGEGPLLGARRLMSRLQVLLKDLAPPGVEGKGGLKGATVEWLTDLFWHAVIFDSPLYPHIGELGVQVSLLVGRDKRPIRRMDPPETIVRSTLRDVREQTARALRRGFEPHEPAVPDKPSENTRRQFFRTLGDVLHSEFEEWASQSPSTGPHAISLALTSNLDLELERGLAADGATFHVAIPVYLGIVREPVAGGANVDRKIIEDVRWLVGTFSCVATDPTIDDLATPDGSWRPVSTLRAVEGGSYDLHGPLVLKLNGSPLHEIPANLSDGGVELPDLLPEGRPKRRFGPLAQGDNVKVEIEHAIALGEYDFLQLTRISQWSFDRVDQPSNDGSKLSASDGLPGWLIEQIRLRERYWMLLGHRLADWNSRTQVHTFLAHDARPIDRGCAVSLEFDQDRIRFLDWLGITQASGEGTLLIDRFDAVVRARREASRA